MSYLIGPSSASKPRYFTSAFRLKHARRDVPVRGPAGDAFYRPESAQARDLAILAARVHKKKTGELKVLDVMAGCGGRAARYLCQEAPWLLGMQAQADLVWANDINPRNMHCISANLQRYAPDERPVPLHIPGLRRPALELSSHAPYPDSEAETHEPRKDQSPAQVFYNPGGASDASKADDRGAQWRARLSTFEGKRLLTACYMGEDFYDVVDVDVFGSDTSAIGAAIDVARFGGLLYLTSTDGFSSSGKRPERALAAYGAYTRAHPFCNEQGLRMLIGAAVREAAVRGRAVEPLFSLYSPHGPVFRVMLRVTRSKEWSAEQYGFVGFSYETATACTVPFRKLGAVKQRDTGGGAVHPPMTLAGPMWTGPLHSTAFVQDMAAAARQLDWSGHSFDTSSGVKTTGHNPPQRLEALLARLEQESDPALPPWFVPLRDVARRTGGSIPSRDDLVTGLQARGFAACASHVETRAVKTSASMNQIVECVTDLGAQGRCSQFDGADSAPDVNDQHDSE